jgi:hypothetical protein
MPLMRPQRGKAVDPIRDQSSKNRRQRQCRFTLIESNANQIIIDDIHLFPNPRVGGGIPLFRLDHLKDTRIISWLQEKLSGRVETTIPEPLNCKRTRSKQGTMSAIHIKRQICR